VRFIDRTTSAHIPSSQCFPLLPPLIIYKPHKPPFFSQLDVSHFTENTKLSSYYFFFSFFFFPLFFHFFSIYSGEVQSIAPSTPNTLKSLTGVIRPSLSRLGPSQLVVQSVYRSDSVNFPNGVGLSRAPALYSPVRLFPRSNPRRSLELPEELGRRPVVPTMSQLLMVRIPCSLHSYFAFYFPFTYLMFLVSS
jgi:hypothetical protein